MRDSYDSGIGGDDVGGAVDDKGGGRENEDELDGQYGKYGSKGGAVVRLRT